MADEPAYVLLQILAGCLSLVVGITAWCCAAALWQVGTKTPVRDSELPRGVAWYRILGWLLMWTGSLGLFALAVGSGTAAVVEVQLVTRAPVAIFVTLAALMTLIAVINASAGLRAMLLRAAELPGHEESEPESLGTRLSRWLPTPLGLLSATIGVTAIVTILAEAGILVIGLGQTDEHYSILLLLLALLGEGMTFIGLVLAMAAELLTLPWETIDTRRRLFIGRLLYGTGVVCVLVVAAPLLIVGLLGLLLLGVLLIGIVAGARRASGLTAFWTLAHAVKARQPLDRELAAQAESSRGRASYLLGSASQALAQGIPLEEAAFHRGLVPWSSWLEVRGGMSSGKLREALAAAAARETERFSRMASPGRSRLSAAYFGVLWGVLVQIVCFVLYYIVPKFKKIFEDFDTELPELLVTLINFLDFGGFFSLFLLSGFAVLAAALVIEALVDYYGWEGMLERFGSRFRVRFATPDMLRGLRWAILAKRPLDVVLQDMGDTPVPFLVRTGLHRAAGGIRQGEEPWLVLQEVGWIRREEAELLRCAQAAGNLPWALDALSQSVTNRRNYRVEWWLQALHPLLVLSIAAFVAWFAIAMFLPLVKLLNDLS